MAQPVDVAVGRRLRSRRKELGLSQAEVARDLDISAQKLGKYERGQDRMRARHIFLAARYLGVSVGYFFRGAAPANDDRPAGKERRSGQARITTYAGILCDPELGGAVGADRAREARERRGPFRSAGLGREAAP